MGGGLESRCVGRVYGADGGVPSYFIDKFLAGHVSGTYVLHQEH